jgi:uncharacterized membrane protein YeaQ/YmgE (transglycosylase-associated protein family)
VGSISFLLLLALQGLVVGAFARLALPGPDPLSLLQTMAVGLGGTFIAGAIVYAATDGRAAPGFLISLVFAVGILLVIRKRRGGGLVSPGSSDRER